jgi:tRNA (guanosine-2'-O-)-methyltransferase
VTLQRYQRIQAVLAKRQPDLTILAEAVHKPHNLSAMLRSADAVGVGTVHAVNPTGGLPTYNETSASAERWVNLRVHASLAGAVAELRGAGMQVLAAHFSPAAVDYTSRDYTRPTCVLFGNEKEGVSDEAAALADAHILIPMLGMVPSLNVSVATAVVMFEAQRQRLQAGMYDTPRLAEHERGAQAFAWLFPRAAALLLTAGHPLPAPTPEGEIPSDTAALLARLSPTPS